MNFRRAAKDGEITTETQTEHVGRWIAKAERAIKIERRAIKVRFEALRENDLKNIASRDQLFGFHDHRFKLGASCIARRGRKIRGGFGVNRLQHTRLAQL